MKSISVAPRAVAFTLCLTLGLPSPAFGLRAQTPKQSSGLEELTAALAGMEEVVIIDENRLFNREPHFLDAVRYFNQTVLPSPEMTWDHAIELFRRFRGEQEDPSLHARRIQAIRESSALASLMLLVNDRSFRDEDNTQALRDRVDYLIRFFMRWDPLVSVAGFDRTPPMEGTEPNLHPASGHHRLIWFMVNYLLIQNGCEPLYLKDPLENQKLMYRSTAEPILRERIRKRASPSTAGLEEDERERRARFLEEIRSGRRAEDIPVSDVVPIVAQLLAENPGDQMIFVQALPIQADRTGREWKLTFLGDWILRKGYDPKRGEGLGPALARLGAQLSGRDPLDVEESFAKMWVQIDEHQEVRQFETLENVDDLIRLLRFHGLLPREEDSYHPLPGPATWGIAIERKRKGEIHEIRIGQYPISLPSLPLLLPEEVRILIVEGPLPSAQQSLLGTVQEVLRESEHPLAPQIQPEQIQVIAEVSEAIGWMRKNHPQLIFIDLNDPTERLEIARQSHQEDPQVPVIFFSRRFINDLLRQFPELSAYIRGKFPGNIIAPIFLPDELPEKLKDDEAGLIKKLIKDAIEEDILIYLAAGLEEVEDLLGQIGQALAQAANDPSRRHLKAAKKTLDRMIRLVNRGAQLTPDQLQRLARTLVEANFALAPNRGVETYPYQKIGLLTHGLGITIPRPMYLRLLYRLYSVRDIFAGEPSFAETTRRAGYEGVVNLYGTQALERSTNPAVQWKDQLKRDGIVALALPPYGRLKEAAWENENIELSLELFDLETFSPGAGKILLVSRSSTLRVFHSLLSVRGILVSGHTHPTWVLYRQDALKAFPVPSPSDRKAVADLWNLPNSIPSFILQIHPSGLPGIAVYRDHSWTFVRGDAGVALELEKLGVVTEAPPTAGLEEDRIPGSYFPAHDDPTAIQETALHIRNVYHLPEKAHEALIGFLEGRVRIPDIGFGLWELARRDQWEDRLDLKSLPFHLAERRARRISIHAWISARYSLRDQGSRGIFRYLWDLTGQDEAIQQILKERPAGNTEEIIQLVGALDGIQAIQIFDLKFQKPRDRQKLTDLIRQWRPWIRIEDSRPSPPPSDIPSLNFVPDSVLLVNTASAVEGGWDPDSIRIWSTQYPNALEGRIPDLDSADGKEILSLLVRLDRKFRSSTTGLEEDRPTNKEAEYGAGREWVSAPEDRLEAVVNQLAEAAQGQPGVLVITQGGLEEHPGLIRFARHREFARRMILFTTLAAAQLAKLQELGVRVIKESDFEGLVLALLSRKEADRVTVLEEAGILTQALAKVLPSSMRVIHLKTGAQIKAILSAFIPEEELDRFDAEALGVLARLLAA